MVKDIITITAAGSYAIDISTFKKISIAISGKNVYGDCILLDTDCINLATQWYTLFSGNPSGDSYLVAHVCYDPSGKAIRAANLYTGGGSGDLKMTVKGYL